MQFTGQPRFCLALSLAVPSGYSLHNLFNAFVVCWVGVAMGLVDGLLEIWPESPFWEERFGQ